MPVEERIGRVTHYYPQAHAASVRIEQGVVHLGDVLRFKGRGLDLEIRVTSLEKDHTPIAEAHDGEIVGVGLDTRVRQDADVYVIRDPYEVEDGAPLAELFAE